MALGGLQLRSAQRSARPYGLLAGTFAVLAAAVLIYLLGGLMLVFPSDADRRAATTPAPSAPAATVLPVAPLTPADLNGGRRGFDPESLTVNQHL